MFNIYLYIYILYYIYIILNSNFFVTTIQSVTYFLDYLYSFITSEYCRHIFNNVIVFIDTINNYVSNKITKYDCENKIIHFREGNLIKILSENESEDKVNNILKKIEKIETINYQDAYPIFNYKVIDIILL